MVSLLASRSPLPSAHLETLEKNAALALHANVLGPLHEAAHIALDGEGPTDAEGLGTPLVERVGGLQGNQNVSKAVKFLWRSVKNTGSGCISALKERTTRALGCRGVLCLRHHY